MASAERNFSTCEREEFSVIFALRKFCVYLFLDEQFTVVTDHKTLQYAFQKRDVYGRLERWMDFFE